MSAHASEASRANARLGQVLCGKYRLDRALGFGGMATVHAATHRNGMVRTLLAYIERQPVFMVPRSVERIPFSDRPAQASALPGVRVAPRRCTPFDFSRLSPRQAALEIRRPRKYRESQ